MSDGTVNTQIIDAVAVNATLLTGQSPSQAFGMLDTVMAETLGMAMHNAVMRQQAGSMVSSAAVTAACAKMLQAPYPIPVPPPPVPPPPPTIDKLDPPPSSTPPTPTAVINAAVGEGEAAISVLKAAAETTTTDATLAQQGLAKLAHDATVSPPPPPPPPSPPPPSPPPPSGGGGDTTSGGQS